MWRNTWKSTVERECHTYHINVIYLLGKLIMLRQFDKLVFSAGHGFELLMAVCPPLVMVRTYIRVCNEGLHTRSRQFYCVLKVINIWNKIKRNIRNKEDHCSAHIFYVKSNGDILRVVFDVRSNCLFKLCPTDFAWYKKFWPHFFFLFFFQI